MKKDNYHKKKQKTRKHDDRSTDDEGKERNHKALAEDMRSRIIRGESYISPNRKELFRGRSNDQNLGPQQEEHRPWEISQKVVGVTPVRQKMEGMSLVGGSLSKSVQAQPFSEPQPELQDLPLRQRQLLDLQQQGELPSDLLPSPHHEDFAGRIQIKGVATLPPVIHPDRVPFLRHPRAPLKEQQQHTHQLPYQQNYSPTSSWEVEWTPSPKNMSPALGMVVRNARDRTSGSGPSNANTSASRTNGDRRSNGVKDDDEEIPLVDAPAPDKSKIVVASQYLFQHQIEGAGMMEERDVAGRLIGIQLIEGVRKALRMPIKTYGTACVFYSRYRYHLTTTDDKDTKYDPRDAALACLWLASKAEETPKKSKEILCAARNLTIPFEDHLTPDDEIFEHQSKVMITLERYLLEIVAFDFRARNSAEVLAGLCHAVGADRATGTAALAICLDVYRTLAVLKQTRQTLACACLELAARFLEKGLDTITDDEMYIELGTSRAEVIETQKDLLDLYMNHQSNTEAGPKYNLNDFMRVSIALKSEMDGRSLPRYTYIQKIITPLLPRESPTTSPHTDMKSTPTILATPRTPGPLNPALANGTSSAEREIEIGRPVTPPPEFLLVAASQDVSMLSASPTSPTSPSEAPNPDDPSQITSVVRFVLDASRARDEKLTIAPYYDIIEQEITEERNLWVPKMSPSARREKERASPPPRDRDRERGRDDRDRGDRDREGDRRRTYTPPPTKTRAPFLKHPVPSDRRPDSPPSRRASPPPRNRDERNHGGRRDYSPPANNNRNSGSRWETDRNRDRSPANSGRGGSGGYRRGNDRERERSRDRSPMSRTDREDRDRDSRYRRDDRNSDRGRYYRD